MNKGYTLIELVVTISLLVVVLVGGTSIFYRSFRSSGVDDSSVILSTNIDDTFRKIETIARFGEIKRVGLSGDRESCLNAGALGISDDSITIEDVNGGVAVFAKNGEYISSNSAQITSTDVTVRNFTVNWICSSGSVDRLKIAMELRPSDFVGALVIGRTAEKEIYLLNSGLN